MTKVKVVTDTTESRDHHHLGIYLEENISEIDTHHLILHTWEEQCTDSQFLHIQKSLFSKDLNH